MDKNLLVMLLSEVNNGLAIFTNAQILIILLKVFEILMKKVRNEKFAIKN